MPADIGEQFAPVGPTFSAIPGANAPQNSLRPTEIVDFENARVGARGQAQRALSMNAFDRGVLNLQNRRSVRAANRDFGFRMERVPEQFARRGLLRSGNQLRFANRLQDDQQLLLNDMAFNLQNELGLLNLSDQNIESQLAESISGIDAAELALRALRASEV